ncbi:hypothetical protein GCM10023116_20980 [Kistimonas scapharcae]|uniref:PRTRC system protein B n=1 Tax=Kistimonas scapharcae TaxID=1036133 RepID=A0ABP8V4J2_9GAMM
MVNIVDYDHAPIRPAPAPVPHTALIFYQSEGELMAVTRHSVSNSGHIGLGEIVDSNALSELVLSNTIADTGRLIPHNVLLNNGKHIIWHTKRQQRSMWIRQDRPRRLSVEYPPLLFVSSIDGRDVRIFGLPSNSRPTLTTRLYHAPLANIYEDGRLCQGTATLPSSVTLDNLADCESCLFDSQFTHINHSKTLKGCETSKKHFDYWVAKSKTREKVKASEMIFIGRLDNVLRGVL